MARSSTTPPSTVATLPRTSLAPYVPFNSPRRSTDTNLTNNSQVLYGDPELKLGSITGLQKSQIKEFCASGDGVCETGTFAITAAHLSYTTNGDTTQGANFILQQAGSGGASSGGSDSSDSGSDSSSGSSSGGLSGLLGGGLGGLGGLGSSSASDSGDASGTSSASAGDATSSGAASSGGFGSLFGGGSGSKLGGLFGGI